MRFIFAATINLQPLMSQFLFMHKSAENTCHITIKINTGSSLQWSRALTSIITSSVQPKRQRVAKVQADPRKDFAPLPSGINSSVCRRLDSPDSEESDDSPDSEESDSEDSMLAAVEDSALADR